ncbi:hypothetical protein HME9304_01868 [Flagellimonas maritima]|uniref:Flagellar motor protein MotB n=1 Tax=Flagellimonas maritima TaxID=1383885 RepID=A0A2Z4LSQ2_9FLAO|nr:hypothetical protein [Allomuricauda aurantiaca]AWX44863.1 hypothetical protein HME9304_01868 [Allomuricauda aurantiaca]
MKAIRFILLVLICSYSLGIVAQQSANSVIGLRFYERLAQRDADYEQSLFLLSNQDESDYWADQENYERHLGKIDFTSYLVYMKSKKDAYAEHLGNCEHKMSHSELYFQKAKAYVSLLDSDYELGKNASKVAQSGIKN